MKCSALNRKASRTKQQKYITQYKKQQNLVVTFNREIKFQYFKNLGTLKNLKLFWDKCRCNFSNKQAHGYSKVILIEKEEITTNTHEIVQKETLLVSNDEIAKTFNKHVAEMVEKLNTFEWPSNKEDLIDETLTKIIKKFKNHPRKVKIKSKCLIQEKSLFSQFLLKV